MIAFDPKCIDAELDFDTERMIRVAAGDREAFDELVSRHFPSTVRIIAAMLGSSAQAEDLAQEVFMRIYRSRHSYLPTARFTTWLGTITRNAVLNAKRSLARNRVFTTDFSDQVGDSTLHSGKTPAPSVEVEFDARLEQQEAIEIVHHAVSQLPCRQREVIELVHFRGWTYSRAAEEMDTTRKAVKSLLGRGRASLKSNLQSKQPKFAKDL